MNMFNGTIVLVGLTPLSQNIFEVGEYFFMVDFYLEDKKF